MPLETLDAKTFAAQFGELSRLEEALSATPAGSPNHDATKTAYQRQATDLIDYLNSHRPTLTVTVTTEQPEPYVEQVTVSSPGFEQLENGSRMLANALTMLHLIRPRDEYDETFAELDIKKGTLASSTRSMQPSHSPSFGGADTTHFIPAQQNGVLLAVQNTKTMHTDEMAVNNAQSLGFNFSCKLIYVGPDPNNVLARVDPRLRVPDPPGRSTHGMPFFYAPMPAFTIRSGVEATIR